MENDSEVEQALNRVNDYIGISAVFRTVSGRDFWKCSECGYVNDVTEDNILAGDEEEFVRTAYVVCPHCSAHMTTSDYEHYECPDCDCSGVYDYDADTLIED